MNCIGGLIVLYLGYLCWIVLLWILAVGLFVLLGWLCWFGVLVILFEGLRCCFGFCWILCCLV